MSIKSYIEELERTREAMQSNRIQNRTLKKRCDELEDHIKLFLKEKGQAGLKYNGKIIIMENKKTRYVKGKNEREADITSFLSGIGVPNPKEVYTKIEDLSKKENRDKNIITFKKM